ncbi:CCD33 protein, partial [Polypterus senegalus]
MERSQLKIEEKELDFEFEVINMQFNELGNYALRLTVENPLLDNAGEGVQLRVNDGDVLYSSTGTTDIIEQTDLEEIYTSLRHKFVFTLPKGFCKNDKNHDVRLKIEALRIPDNQIKNGVKAGEAFFAIYPRTNAPRINVNAGKNDELYHYSGIMALLRVQNDYLAMHCGRLAYTVKFHEARPPPVNGSSSSRMPSIMEESHSNGQRSKAPSPGPSAAQEPPVSPTASQSEAEPGPSSSPVPQKASPEPQTSPVFSPPKSPPTKSNRRRSPEMPAEYLVDSMPSTPEQDQRQRRLPSEASLHLPSPQYTPAQSPEPLPSTHNEIGKYWFLIKQLGWNENKLAIAVMNTVSWHIRSPLGFSILPLSEDVYRKLMAESSQRGVRVEHLPIEGSTLQTMTSGTPSVGIILRLIGSERPDSLLASSNPSLLPTLDSKPLSDRGDSPEPILPQSRLDSDDSPPIPLLGDSPPLTRASRLQSLLQRGTFDLPSYDALEEILPEYEYLFRVHPATQDPRYGRRHPHRTEPAQPDKSKVTESTERSQSPPRRTHSPKRDPLGQTQVADVAEHEAVELENYQTAMRKMAEDIIALRKHVGSLESHNSRLRSELSLHQDLGRTLLDDMDIDVMTKTEIADRITSLKVKLATETSEVKAQKDKIQQLQNELIRKNDREKELLNLQRAHQQQQMVLQKYHERLAKVKGLESTIRQQEKVIEKMEKVLDTKLKEKKKGLSETSKKLKGNEENIWKEVESALAAENSRLRAELEKIRSPAVPTIIQLPPKQQDWFSDAEKLSLLAKLEKAQGRIESLEMQLEENARKWGREKQDLMTRLTEHDHGFARTSTMILHDFPLVSI